ADDEVSKSAAMVVSSPAREASELPMGPGTEPLIEAQPVPPPTPLEDDPPPTPPHKLELVRSGTTMETAKPPVDIKINTKRKPGSASPPRKRLSPDSPECQTQRQKAEQAARDRSWSVVLTETLRSECWPSSTGRKVMRLEALMELGRYEQCVSEGAGIS